MAFVCPECARSYPAPGFCTEDGGALNDSAFCPLLGEWVGSYRVATLIGQGGMGEVYLGVQPEIGSRVAIKVLTADAARAPGVAERFFAEAKAVNVIRHEGIVSVLDLARLPDGRPYIVMECLEGAPLTRVLEQHRPAPLGALVQLLLGVLDALGAAHAQGITHRDIKPDNIFITSMGRTKLLDFGIAKLRPDIAGISGATRTGALLGTPFYMSPEQARGQAVDHRSDIYSLGVIAFEGCTGQRPFAADNLYDLLRQHIEVPPARPTELRPDIPPAFESVILRALEKDPAHRFQSTGQLGDALRQIAPFLPPSSFVTLTGQPTIPPRPILLAGGSTGPTAPGYANTMPERATAAPQKSGLSVVALGLGGVLGLGALLIVGVAVTLFVLADRAPSGAAARPAQTPGGDKGPSGVIDMKRFDPIAFTGKAKQLAQSKMAGVELATIVITNPNEDGSVDISDEDSEAVVYAFVKAQPGEMVPVGQCAVWVSFSMGSAMATLPSMASCMVGTGRAPRCSVAKVLKAAGLGNKATLTYGPTETWTVVGEDDGFKMVPDDC